MESSSRLVAELARELATPTFGVVSRRQLNAAGIDRHAIRTQVRAGRWAPHGAHALRIHDAPWCPVRSVIISSVLNAGASAWADGEAALVLAGSRDGARRVSTSGFREAHEGAPRALFRRMPSPGSRAAGRAARRSTTTAWQPFRDSCRTPSPGRTRPLPHSVLQRGLRAIGRPQRSSR